MSAETIARQLGSARRAGQGWSCRCPGHDDRSPSLSIRDGDNGVIVHCHAGCDWRDVRAELRRRGLLAGDAGGNGASPDPAEIERRRDAEARDRQRRIAIAVYFWNNETVDPHGTIVETYWRSRGLSPLIPPTIRASRSWVRHPEGGQRPCMIALVEHVDHGAVAIHRTFLAIDGSGKAAFKQPRLSLGPVGGAAVRLAPAGEKLVVAEGIETGASVMIATGLPAWSGLSAGGIEGLVLPPLPLASTVIIAADHDVSGTGERAARTAAARWLREGRRVRIALPRTAGSDWNDVLRNKDLRDACDVAA